MSLLRALKFILVLIFATLFHSTALSATIFYGDFSVSGTGITFQNVRESSSTDPVPLFNAPDPFDLGLEFDPTSFGSLSSGGNADATSGQVNFTVIAAPNVGLNTISLSESGDYTLVGTGGAGTGAFAGAIIRATVTEIDGAPVAPFDLVPVNASFGDTLPGATIVNPWSFGLSLNVGAQLPGFGYPANARATKVDIVIDNQLLTTSESASLAFINKTDFRINLTTVGSLIPEPHTLMLTSIATCGLCIARRKRRA